MQKIDHPKYRIVETSTKHVLYQIYKLKEINADGTAEYERDPDYEKTGGHRWFKTKEAAQECINEQLQTT